MYHFRASLPKWVLTTPKKISSHIFKMAIFPKFFEDFMTHIIRLNRDKEIKLFPELSINKIFGDSFVRFISDRSLVVVCHFVCSLLKLKVLISSCSSQYCGCYSTCSTRAKYATDVNKMRLVVKAFGDEEPYYSTNIWVFSLSWAGLAAFHKASTI